MLTTHDLSHEECARLLGAGMAGRVALGAPTGTHIVPVNYAVDGDSILVRTTAYSLLGTYGRDAQLCFEVDQFDATTRTGWSVLVQGTATIVDDESDIRRLDQAARAPWVPPHPGPSTWVRIRTQSVTGRALV